MSNLFLVFLYAICITLVDFFIFNFVYFIIQYESGWEIRFLVKPSSMISRVTSLKD